MTTKELLKIWLKRVGKTPVLLVLSAEILLGVVFTATTFVLFWKVTDTVLDNERFQFDVMISQFFYSLRTPWLTSVMRFFSFIGMDGVLILSAMIPIFFFLKRKKYEATVFSIMIGVGALLNMLLKVLIQRPRPTIAPLVIENSYSFPSGHSMNSFIFFLAVAYYLFHFSRKKKLGLLAFGCAVVLSGLIGISRIYLGVHYPSDVLAGFVTGLLWFLMVLLIEKTIAFYRIFKVSKD